MRGRRPAHGTSVLSDGLGGNIVGHNDECLERSGCLLGKPQVDPIVSINDDAAATGCQDNDWAL